MQIVNFLFLFFFQYQRIKLESAQEKEGKTGYWEGKPRRFSVEITNRIICLSIVNKPSFENQVLNCRLTHLTEVRFASFFSGGFITSIIVNPPERNLAKRTSDFQIFDTKKILYS